MKNDWIIDHDPYLVLTCGILIGCGFLSIVNLKQVCPTHQLINRNRGRKNKNIHTVNYMQLCSFDAMPKRPPSTHISFMLLDFKDKEILFTPMKLHIIINWKAATIETMLIVELCHFQCEMLIHILQQLPSM